MHLSLKFFGTFQATLDGQTIRNFRSVNGQGLLVYMALQAKRPFPRDLLATLFWPHDNDSTAKRNLRQTLYQLRQLLQDSKEQAEPFLLVTRQTVQFNHASDHTLDVQEFVQNLADGDWATAVSHYTAELLPGFTCDSLDFEEWLRGEREQLHRLALDALSELGAQQLRNGRLEAAQATARRHLALEAWSETAQQQLMEALALAGNRTAALAQFEQCRQILDEELGIAPAAATLALAERIQNGELHPIDPDLIAGRYSLDREIGRGAMGTVYQGRDSQTGQAVAIKMLHSDKVAHDPSLVQRFLREGEALRQLNHPNIVTILATDEKDGRHALVMEYIEGGDLQSLLGQQSPLPLKRILAIALGLADALTRAHHLHILHRDLKPGNILLDADGGPRLSDFGIARLGHNSELTQTGVIMGTMAYLSPEGCRGETLDERADIWSFGVLLYEMLTGERPFDAPTLPATITAIIQAPLPDISRLRPDIPPQLLDLLTSMLAKRREERIASIRVVGLALEALLHGTEYQLPTSSLPATTIATLPEPLPQPHTSLIGRLAETSHIIQNLNQPDCQLLTLVGRGGVGKTRLALEVAQTFAEQTGQPVFFVSLTDVLTTTQAAVKIATAVGAAHIDSSQAEPTMMAQLQQQPGLLILDNIESLVVADGDAFVALLNHMNREATAVRLLATSRQPLQAQQERVLILHGLPVPSSTKNLTPATWQQYDALALFRQRARQARLTFELLPQNITDVVELCQLLQGLPLGIELAAAQMRHASVGEILVALRQDLASLRADLRDLPPRQRSLTAVFEQSWQNLTPVEQEALAQTAVFHNGFSRAAARAVLGDGADHLESLVEKSLLNRQQMVQALTRIRYHLPPLLQAYLAEKDIVGMKEHDRHAEYYLAWAVNHRSHLAAERDNITAAWAWAQLRKNVAVPRRWQPNWLSELDDVETVIDIEARVEPTAILIGREAEMAQCRQALSPILHQPQNGGLLTIMGAAGIGKSHLVAQLRAEYPQLTWFDCPAQEANQQALHPFRHWLRHYFGQTAIGTPAAADEAAFAARFEDILQATAAEALGNELKQNRSFLAALVDIILPNSAYTHLQPEQRLSHFQRAIKTLITAESSLQPVVLHIEDAHWLDEESRSLIENLLRHVSPYPFLLIVTTRSEQFEPFTLLDAPQQTLKLASLTAAALTQLAQHHLGSPASSELITLLQDRSSGNPFYAEQILLYLRENGLVAKGKLVQSGGYAHFDTSLPLDIHNLLIARLGQLDTQTRAVVAQAAVLGHEFSLPLLQRMAGKSELSSSLSAAAEAAIWQPISPNRYVFNHALLREAAYTTQFAQQRQTLHKQAAQAVTAVASHNQPQYATIAHHYDEAHEPKRAVTNYQKAGDQARDNYFIREAHAHYTRGLTLAENDRQRLPLLLGRETVNHWLGNREEQRADLQHLVTLTAVATDKALLADIMLRRATFALATADYETAVQLAQQTTSLAVVSNNRTIEAKAMNRWGRAVWQQGKPKSAEPLLKRALKLAQMTNDVAEQAHSHYDLSIIASYRKAYEEAQNQLKQALTFFEELDDRRNVIRSINMLGLIGHLQGDYEAALDYLIRAVEMCRQVDWTYGEAFMLGHVGNCYFDLGYYARSREICFQALDINRAIGNREGEVLNLDTIGLTYYFESNLPRARELFEAALTLANETNQTIHRAYLKTHLGLTLTNLEEVEDAGILLYDAIALRDVANDSQAAIDTSSALAWLDMARGDTMFAVERALEIATLLRLHSIDGIELPLHVYWQCFTILDMAGKQSEASAMLQEAMTLLEKRAHLIKDDAMRSQYLAIPHHRQLQTAWNSRIA